MKRTLLIRTADASEYALLSTLLNRLNPSSMFSLGFMYIRAVTMVGKKKIYSEESALKYPCAKRKILQFTA